MFRIRFSNFSKSGWNLIEHQLRVVRLRGPFYQPGGLLDIDRRGRQRLFQLVGGRVDCVTDGCLPIARDQILLQTHDLAERLFHSAVLRLQLVGLLQ